MSGFGSNETVDKAEPQDKVRSGEGSKEYGDRPTLDIGRKLQLVSEIRDALERGISGIFLIGLISFGRRYPEDMYEVIAVAANEHYKELENRTKTAQSNRWIEK